MINRTYERLYRSYKCCRDFYLQRKLLTLCVLTLLIVLCLPGSKSSVCRQILNLMSLSH